MNEQVKTVIETYAQGATARNVNQVALVLSPAFRVVANRFRDTTGTTIIDRETYLSQLNEGKIGGAIYRLEYIAVTIYAHTAQAEVWYRGEKSDIHNFFDLAQNEQDQWLLVGTMAVVITK